MNPYNYLFYRIYKRHNTKYSKPESVFFASMVVSCIIFLNLFTVGIFLYRSKLIPLFIGSKLQSLLLILLILAFNSYYFYSKKRYLGIEDNYVNISKKRNNLGTFFILLYVLISLVFFIIAVNFKR